MNIINTKINIANTKKIMVTKNSNNNINTDVYSF